MDKYVTVFDFTSESVTEGHPDKVCDAVSDAVLDAYLAQDPEARVACETAVKGNTLILLGEISSKTDVSVCLEDIARGVIRDIGYDSAECGMDWRTFEFVNLISAQSCNINAAVDKEEDVDDYGAGDQGIMFGYASDETEARMPMTHLLANLMSERLTEVRKNGTMSYLRPDGKTQVTMTYGVLPNGHIEPIACHTIVLSTQTAPGTCQQHLSAEIKKYVIDEVIPTEYLTESTRVFINPSGCFEIGGPAADAGVTGRKIIVDTYGGWGAHGGGAFSGKDYTKVDRSASYYSRWVAKSIVDAGLARRCLVQVSYAIGVQDALSVFIEDYGTSSIPVAQLTELVRKVFSFRPAHIAKQLGLKQPIYRETAHGGHFGRAGLPWEDTTEAVRRLQAELA